MALERRVDDVEDPRMKRRRINQQQAHDSSSQNGHASGLHYVGPNHNDKVPGTSPPSREFSPNGALSFRSEPEEARSSGILDLVELPKSPPYVPSRRVSPPREEARSSGFLALDPVKRLNCKVASAVARDLASTETRMVARRSPNRNAQPLLKVEATLARPGIDSMLNRSASVEFTEIQAGDMSPNRRKWQGGLMPLDVLADVSVASPLIH